MLWSVGVVCSQTDPGLFFKATGCRQNPYYRQSKEKILYPVKVPARARMVSVKIPAEEKYFSGLKAKDRTDQDKASHPYYQHGRANTLQQAFF